MKTTILMDVFTSIITTSAIIHYLYIIKGDYPFFFIATILIVSQFYMVISTLISQEN